MEVEEQSASESQDHKESVASQWVNIYPLSKCIREPHIMELLETASVSLDHPLACIIRLSNDRERNNWCILKLQSVDEAKVFVEKFNGFEMKKNKGRKLRVKMYQKKKELSQEEIESSKWLRITNLNPNVSEKQLADHIQKETKITPKSVEIIHNIRSDYPSFALVQIGNLKDTKKVMKKLQMNSLEGQKMWIQQCRERNTSRNEHLKGCITTVRLEHLPLDTDGLTSEIQKLCEEHGEVKFMRLFRDKQGYFERTAKVEMSSFEEADAVFDELHETEINGCTITTRYAPRYPNSNSLFIGGLPKSATKSDISDLVKEAVNERPIFIRINPPNDEYSGISAIVTFSDRKFLVQCFMNLNGKEYGENTIKLQEHQLKDAKAVEKLKKSKRVKMENLSRNVTEQKIMDHLRKYSKIKNPPKMINLVHHSSEWKRGFAFVELKSHEDAQKVVDNVCSTELEGKKCWIELRKEVDNRYESQRGKTNTVVLRNLHYKVGEDAIRSLCEGYGRVRGISLPKDKEGYPLCFAYVDMERAESAERLFDDLHGVKVKNVPIWVTFKPKGRLRGSPRDRVFHENRERGDGRERGRFKRTGSVAEALSKLREGSGSVRPSGSRFSGRKKFEGGSSEKRSWKEWGPPTGSGIKTY